MLYDDPILYFKGLTIFKDFSDPRTFYYLPPDAPRIARSAEGGESGDYALRLVLFRPDPAAPPPQGMEDGGGFLNLDTDLHVTERVLNDVREELRRRFGAEANLVPVPFMNGSVELVLLGVKRDEEGQPFVRKVAGSTVPSLYGTQRAAFSTVLDRHGAALMRSVIAEGGVTMALAIYHLTYAGIPPAYNLKITIDYQRVYDHLDLRVRAGVTAGSGSSSFVAKAGFHMLMEELKENRAIKVEEVDPIPGENGRTPTNQEMINEIIGNLMGSRWFKPTLTNAGSVTDLGAQGAAAAGGAGTGAGGTAPSGTGTGAGTTPSPAAAGQRQNAQWREDSRTPTPFPADRGVEPFQPSTSGTQETLVIRGAGATAKVGTQADALQPRAIEGNRLQVDVAEGATQHVEIRWPAAPGAAGERRPATWIPGTTEGPIDQRGVEPFQASTSGTSETLVIRGEGATARVGPSESALGPAEIRANRLSVDLPAGQERHVEITWPAQEAQEDTFHLFFAFDQPENQNEVDAYSTGTPPPPGDNRFLQASQAKSASAPGGLASLGPWLAGLQGNTVRLRAYASYERDDTDLAHNQQLSERRMEVAARTIERLRPNRFNSSDRSSLGHVPAASNTVPTITPGGGAPDGHGSSSRPEHRAAIIYGLTREARPRTVVRGRLRREQPVGGAGQPESVLRGHLERARGGGRPAEGGTSSIQASLEVNLEMIQQEERVTATYELNTRKARTHEIHPQGQLILDVIDPARYLLEADGAIDFFQWLEINASTTAAWALDGIHSIQVQLRYAPNGAGGFQRSSEIMLTPAQDRGSWKVGVLHENADNSRPVVYWYEYKVIVNYTQDVALGNQQGAVSSVGNPKANPEGWIRTDARNLVIHPRDITPAMTVNVETGVMQYDLLAKAQLALIYGPHRQNLELSAAKPSHRLVVRPEPQLRGIPLRTEGTLFYKDNARVPLPAQEWKPQELIVINEPRENILRVRVILADPAGDYRQVMVRLRYEHGARVIEQPLELKEHAEIKEWAVRLEDPESRTWRYTATLVKKSGDIDEIPWTDGKNEQLILGVRAVDVIPVEVTWLMVPPAADLIAVKIDLLYEDASNGVRWDRSELIRQGHTGMFTWSIPIKDEARRTYRYRVTEFRATGQKQAPWLETDEEKLVLLPIG